MSRRISDFRPISLITSLYKIIAKVLAGRIRGVLHETIHSTQGAFVQGRQILDAVLIANEIVDEKRRSGEEGVVFKIDFEKAYDHVILVNGNAKGWVKASRGLRQGDPLSPFLFTIVADVLSRMLLKAEERNVLEGFKVGRNTTRVSHLQFADDTIFFSSSREEDMMTLKNVLLVFGHISGLKVNLDKSNIYGINLEQNHLSRLAEMLDCKASGWPILYLGLPLGGNPKTSGFWDPVIERISRRLDGWQKTYLSFGGRITLIQSCLTHMPCYFLSLFKIPASVAAKIERMQRDFLWSGVGKGKRDHLVNWDVVCKPKSRGGLGFGKISIRNVALLGKWLWRYPREGSALWHQVILSIYGSHSNGWDVNNIVRWSHRCPWKAIALVYQEFSKFTRFVVEDLEGLMQSFDRLHISSSVPDKRSWSLSPLGLFTVKSFFLALSQYSESSPIFPTKFVWNAQVPFKVKSFVWLVAHKKVNTNDLLQLRRPYKALSPDISASWLRINLAKSEILPVGVVEKVDEMVVELGCRVGQLPAVYLGLPLGAPNKASSMWDGWKRDVVLKIPASLCYGCAQECHSGRDVGPEFRLRITMEEDLVFWKEGRNGQFSVKKAYNMLVSPIAAVFPKSNVWVDRVPTKIVFFAWEAAWGRCLLLIGFRKEGDNFLIVVSCVVVKRKR
ncbi:putative ribonuclease H protein [Vitis vinifera]|uniref:Putative ribonuclease H protein n=1 Tax=Vitis vinifera TaxID=29760 RepID=A0A438JNC2_VITVI|nr:putative ribonuclease H protein [Vitis vinifera]